MAYQSLNIIGSFNAGTTAIQREVVADRDRADAYRAQLRRQVTIRQGTVEGVSEAQDRMVIEDNAHEPRRNPYMFQRYRREQAAPPEAETPDQGVEPGGALDVVV